MTVSSESRITIVGGGLDYSAHASSQACRALRTARRVFHAGCDQDVADWLARLAPDAEVIDIDEGFYQIGQYRPDMYRQMARGLVEAALEVGEVALIEPGSAMVTDLVTPLVLAEAAQSGVATRVIPGISSLEHIFIAFGVDPSSGLQVVLAQELVARDLRLSPRMDTVVIQPGYYDSLWCFGWPRSRADRFDALIETLSGSFAPSQPMALVRFPMSPDDITHVFWFKLEDLAQLAEILTPLHSLFIPAAMPGGRDAAFQRRMSDWETGRAFLETDARDQIAQLAAVPSNADVAARAAHLPPALQKADQELAAAWSSQQQSRAFARVSTIGQPSEPAPATPDLAQILALRAETARDPGDLRARDRLEQLVRTAAPAWHFPMMADERRNDAYDLALRRAAPGRRVLEIGAGGGLLAMMAARAGAAEVTTCEAVPAVAETARRVIRDNRLEDRISVHALASQALEVGRDLGAPAQVLVTEIFGSSLVSEGALSAIADARRRLLAPGAVTIPRRAAAYAYLAGGARLEALFRGTRRAGFDLSAFDAFSPPWLTTHLDRTPHDVLSEDFAVFDFDFESRDFAPDQRILHVQAKAAGDCVCLVQWLRLDLDSETTYENRPDPSAGPNGWMHVLHPLAASRRVRPGETVTLVAAHDTRDLTIALAPEVAAL